MEHFIARKNYGLVHLIYSYFLREILLNFILRKFLYEHKVIEKQTFF